MEKCEKGAQTIENLFQITYSQITPDHDYKILFNDQLSLNSQVMSDELMGIPYIYIYIYIWAS